MAANPTTCLPVSNSIPLWAILLAAYRVIFLRYISGYVNLPLKLVQRLPHPKRMANLWGLTSKARENGTSPETVLCFPDTCCLLWISCLHFQHALLLMTLSWSQVFCSPPYSLKIAKTCISKVSSNISHIKVGDIILCLTPELASLSVQDSTKTSILLYSFSQLILTEKLTTKGQTLCSLSWYSLKQRCLS